MMSMLRSLPKRSQREVWWTMERAMASTIHLEESRSLKLSRGRGYAVLAGALRSTDQADFDARGHIDAALLENWRITG